MLKTNTQKLNIFLNYILEYDQKCTIDKVNKSNQYTAVPFCLITFLFLFSLTISAQNENDDYPKDVVPPPLTFISKDEMKQLKAQTKMKKRTKLTLEFMNLRLAKSEQYLEKNKFQKSLNQIGVFRGLLKDVLKFLKGNQGRRGSHKNFKKLEIKLREFLPRLEVIRREMPYRFGFHVKRTIFYVRDSRSNALNPLFDDTVLPQRN